MAINYVVDKHVVCEIGNLIAQNYGEHMVSFKIEEPTDNGKIVKVGKMVSLDLYEMEEATEIDAYVFGKNPTIHIPITPKMGRNIYFKGVTK